MLDILNLLKIRRMRTVPLFVPERFEKFSVAPRKTLKLKWIFGAGRGGRTPTRLPSADFESAASASNFFYISKIIISSQKLCKKMCKFRPVFDKNRPQPDWARHGESLH